MKDTGTSSDRLIKSFFLSSSAQWSGLTTELPWGRRKEKETGEGRTGEREISLGREAQMQAPLSNPSHLPRLPHCPLTPGLRLYPAFLAAFCPSLLTYSFFRAVLSFSSWLLPL